MCFHDVIPFHGLEIVRNLEISSCEGHFLMQRYILEQEKGGDETPSVGHPTG
jgi:hypothetical protein